MSKTLRPYLDLPDVHTSPDHLLLRLGPFLLIFLMLILFIMGYFISYPERLRAKVSITSNPPPIEVKAPATKPLQKLLVKDKEEVVAGQTLIVLENSSNFEDVVKLERWLINFNPENLDLPLDRLPVESMHLGMLQEDYAVLYNAVQAFQLQRNLLKANVEYQHINEQLDFYHSLYYQRESQIQIASQERELLLKDLGRYQTLHRNGSVADADLEEKKIRSLQIEKEIQNLQSQLIETSLSMLELKRYLSRLTTSTHEKLQQLENEIFQSREKLLGNVQLYQSLNLIRSPVNGKVVFFESLRENELLHEGKNIMTILPETDSLYARLWLPVQGSGKVSIGQEARIYLDGYPYEDFGNLRGVVSSLSPIPSEGTYRVELMLPHPMLTSYGFTIPFKQELYGEAEIITQPHRLFERIFAPIRKTFKYQN